VPTAYARHLASWLGRRRSSVKIIGAGIFSFASDAETITRFRERGLVLVLHRPIMLEPSSDVELASGCIGAQDPERELLPSA
jgi:hypothetical protein